MLKGLLKPFQQLRLVASDHPTTLTTTEAFSTRRASKSPALDTLKPFLKATAGTLQNAASLTDATPTLDQLGAWLTPHDPDSQHYILLWLLNQYYHQGFKSEAVHHALWQLIWSHNTPALATHFIHGLKRGLLPNADEVLAFVAQTPFEPASHYLVVEELFWLYLGSSASPKFHKNLLTALKQLDKPHGTVVDYALQSFPLQNKSYNHAIIRLLGATGRYRIVRPLTVFAREYPEYTRTIIRALADLPFDHVDEFFMACLNKSDTFEPLVVLELVRKCRHRNLRRATSALADLFPYQDYDFGIVSQSINYEIALTMAEFGEKDWAIQCLLPELMVNGITRQYLKAIKLLHLTEAIPLLKALLLMPDTPHLSMLQKEAFSICQSLMQKPLKNDPFLTPNKGSEE